MTRARGFLIRIGSPLALVAMLIALECGVKPTAENESSKPATTGEDAHQYDFKSIRDFDGTILGKPFRTGGLAGIAFMDLAIGLPEVNREEYSSIMENGHLDAAKNPKSTFSIDVDTASYSNVRRYLMTEKQKPPADAVRVEELVNYFRYDYPAPMGEHPLAVSTELTTCPWKPEHRLLRIGLRARSNESIVLPPRNFVFLIDVSGSMQAENRLPLVKKSLGMLVDQLQPGDRVAIVVYAGSSGLVLPSTSSRDRDQIRKAIEELEAGGSTNGGEGIQLAYETAAKHFIADGVNRVILATDGDFNVGITDPEELVKLIEAKRKSGVYLTALGYGMGNLKDSTLEKLAQHGNGHYAYIDNEREAHKIFVEESVAMIPVAKDVKIQVEFNAERVKSYRLIGYENRLLEEKDFNDDKKDAGDIGTGHCVTAIYELAVADESGAEGKGDWLTVRLRYKEPTKETGKEMVHPVAGPAIAFNVASADTRFAGAVAAYGMLLRDSKHKGNATFGDLRGWAKSSIGPDKGGHRKEFLELVDMAERLSK